MPGVVSHGAGADASSLNAGRENSDRLQYGAKDPDHGSAMSAKSAAPMDFSRASTTSTAAPHHQGASKPDGPAAGHSQSGNQNHVMNGSLHSSDAAATRRPVETSIWDWDTPLDAIGESASYYYEPQGELLAEHRDRSSNPEFNIPHSVGSVASNWQVVNNDAATPRNNGFAVPKKPDGSAPAVAGIKRKSTAEQDSASGSRPPELKRLSRSMSDGGDEETPSPMDARPMVASTRPPSSMSSRPRSDTQATEGRSRQATEGQRSEPSVRETPRRSATDQSTPIVLPARKVFPIQIGDKLFRLSGASLSSDGMTW
jgi:hypothetical protein